MRDRSRATYQRAAQAAIADANPIEPVRLTVISDSMWPLLRTGDTIRVQPIAPAAICVGEVVVVRRGADWITHRLLAVDGEQWVTGGDNAVFTDAPVSRTACLGRVIAVEGGGQSLDVTQPRWAQLNQRLGQIGRVQWRINRALRVTSASARLLVRLAWLIALPLRAARRWLVWRRQQDHRFVI